MSIAIVTAGVLAANGITIWIIAMFWRMKRNPRDMSAMVQATGLLIVASLIALAAAQSAPGG